jgi:hypothetical protein
MVGRSVESLGRVPGRGPILLRALFGTAFSDLSN